jgi:putative oxidoreductase
MKLLSTKINSGAFNTAMLFLRLTLGILLLHHGYQKMTHFQETEGFMINFLGLGKAISTSLVIFSEVFCSALVILGLFTRFAVFVNLFSMSIAFIMVKHWDGFGHGEIDLVYIIGYFTILLCGPGRISVDSMISK